MNRLFVRSTMIVVGAALGASLLSSMVVILLAAGRAPGDRLTDRLGAGSFGLLAAGSWPARWWASS